MPGEGADTTITVKLNGEPLVGAEVISRGEMDEVFITDGDGKIVKNLPANYCGCVLVAVRHSSLPMAAYIAICILEAGESYEVNIPEYSPIEDGDQIRGMHGHFLAKL